MKKPFKLPAFCLVIILLFSVLTGCCGVGHTMTVNSDGSCTYTMKYMYDKDMYKELASDSSAINSGDFTEGKETVGNYQYVTFTRNFTFASTDELKRFLSNDEDYLKALKNGSKKPEAYNDIGHAPFKDVTLTASEFKATLNSSLSDLEDSYSTKKGSGKSNASTEDMDIIKVYSEAGVRIDISIVLPNAITQSNGTVNNNTATWSLSELPADYKLIAECGGESITTDTAAPVISKVTNGAYYKKAFIAKAKDNVSLKSFTLDKLNMASCEIPVDTDGKHTLIATDSNNNQTKVTFVLDTNKPVIKGVKKGKTYTKPVTIVCKDKYGLKKVTVNGKKIALKNSKKTVKKVERKISKKGTYTIRAVDKAGNIAKVKFKIEK